MAEQEKKSLVEKVVNKEKFNEYLQNAGDKLVVVDFYADWCGPCKMIAPKVEEFAKELVDKVVFLKVNVDECDEVAMDQEIQAMPTFRFFRNGERVHELVGANSNKLRQEIEQFQKQVKQ